MDSSFNAKQCLQRMPFQLLAHRHLPYAPLKIAPTKPCMVPHNTRHCVRNALSPISKPDLLESAQRRSAGYEPSAWGGYFISHSTTCLKPQEFVEGRIKELKEEVATTLRSTTDVVEMMNLVDTIERLGINYHFKREIEDALTYLLDAKLDDADLHQVALRFRLLRQHGFNVSSDEFYKFTHEGDNLDEKLCEDARGLLSLYNAGFLAIPGESILDEAILFARRQLKLMVHELKSPLKEQVLRALKTPLPRMMRRVETRFFIEEYEEDEKRNDILLELAKLDYNFVQSLHSKEIKDLSLWWKELDGVNDLKYARDRLVEIYTAFSLGTYYEPEFSRARMMLTKFYTLWVLMDDTFDIYGTYEECKLLNEAIQRWDEKAADSLPLYLRQLYLGYIRTINGFGDDLEPCEQYRMSYFIEAIKLRFSNSWMQEVVWRAEGYLPTFKERKKTTVDYVASADAVCAILIGIGEVVTEEILRWLTDLPEIVIDHTALARYTDDIVSYEREVTKSKQLPTTIACYMIENNLTKEQASEEFLFMRHELWKRLNQACLRPTVVPMPIIELFIDYNRAIETIYLHFDNGFNESIPLKELIAKLLVEPIPL
ncbi:Sesquiterpene synthase [Rhynchospora pubera]|uniref:Sesquiterpene synthase n=1 Tax=Rhynchospora pubera TaxID=906938 RepID=A0AAV8EQA4_9POAL|nr:Sesquiterpene synthase [Rhynchospora pubera]